LPDPLPEQPEIDARKAGLRSLLPGTFGGSPGRLHHLCRIRERHQEELTPGASEMAAQ